MPYLFVYSGLFDRCYIFKKTGIQTCTVANMRVKNKAIGANNEELSTNGLETDKNTARAPSDGQVI